MLMANSGAFRAATDGPDTKKGGASEPRLDHQDVAFMAVHEKPETPTLREVLGHEAEDGFVRSRDAERRQPKREKRQSEHYKRDPGRVERGGARVGGASGGVGAQGTASVTVPEA